MGGSEQEESREVPATAPRFSVVITAHNAVDTIGACLESLRSQDGVGPGEMEVILVDDRSTDGTVDAAKKTSLPGLRLLAIDSESRRSLTTRQEALDLAFSEAWGEVILTLDADGAARPQWLSGLSDPILAGRADAVSGSVSFDGGKGNRCLAAVQNVDVAVYLAACAVVSAASLDGGVLFGSFAFRAGRYGDLGGYPKLGFALTEDLAFARALRKSGARIRYSLRPDVAVRACRSWSEFLRRAKRVSAGGVAPLSVVLGAWLLLLPILAGAAAVSADPWMRVLFVRWLLGVLFAALALAVSGRWKLLPFAFVYEPLAIIVGIGVWFRVRREPGVEWGGVRYER